MSTECLLHACAGVQLLICATDPDVIFKQGDTSIIKGHRRQVGMKMAMKLENIDLDGTHHRGIDDAKNIQKIY